ncbi:metallophosphoesterase family protein [uncultured Maribacter sp.]|uniref:metallophosphoesterase family protein n=1 Tax=uncultured Maribacter sp. TaxID=431308 RepID=UPI0026167345|nr:metallophosphoesterase family protein [uncultured Maribacter sp.]
MDKKIIHLGERKGKMLIFGGVYSNLQALQALKEVSKEEGIAPENCICTGDIIGYCAQPEETVQLFREWGAKSITGNVELQLFEKAEDCGCDFTQGSRCDNFSKLWYPYAQSKLSPNSIEWMGTLPHHISFHYAGKEVSVVHGSYDTTSEFIFASSPEDIKLKNFKQLGCDVILAGHCGLPFNTSIKDKLWLNSGVIGMPANEGSPRVWYMILEHIEEELQYTHKYLEYDYITAFSLMKENNLPLEYANTLVNGIWDNMDILPSKEQKIRGISYNFNPKKYKHQTIKT